MANNKRRQKKVERRNAKRKQRHREIARQRSRGLGERLMAAAAAPILGSLISEDFGEQGLGQAVFSRQLPSGEVAFAAFLIDRYCLGVKDAYGDIRTRADYRKVLEHVEESGTLVELPPADLRCLIEEAVEYARDLGFEPHPDYRRVRPIFGDVDPNDATEHFEFGHEGKPLFIAGPHEDMQRCYRILSILEDRCGKGEFHYMLPALGGTAAEIGGFSETPQIARVSPSGHLEWSEEFDDEEDDEDDDE
jgi:hypothetical protein